MALKKKIQKYIEDCTRTPRRTVECGLKFIGIVLLIAGILKGSVYFFFAGIALYAFGQVVTEIQ